jgi:hypothetical protein
VHKFTFQWELAAHLLVCILSLTPFFFTGRRLFSLIPISVWGFYNVLFLVGPQFANRVVPRFGRVKLSFKNTIEEFFSAKLLPVLSISFLCAVSLKHALTALTCEISAANSVIAIKNVAETASPPIS